MGSSLRIGHHPVRGGVGVLLQTLLRRRLDQSTPAADTHRHRRQHAAGKAEDVRIELARLQNRDLFRATPLGERQQLFVGGGLREAVNRKDGNRFGEDGHSGEPDADRMKAHGMHTETPAVESCQQLEHLPLSSAGDEAVDEDRDRNGP